MFKVGDRVRRIAGMHHVLPIAWEGVITEVAQSSDDEQSIKFAEYKSSWYAYNFELVKESKMNKHKHAELIKAWADGAQIQYKGGNNTWNDEKTPVWSDWTEYRIKPEPKPDIEFIECFKLGGSEGAYFALRDMVIGQKVKFVVDAETGKLKSVGLLYD